MISGETWKLAFLALPSGHEGFSFAFQPSNLFFDLICHGPFFFSSHMTLLETDKQWEVNVLSGIFHTNADLIFIYVFIFYLTSQTRRLQVLQIELTLSWSVEKWLYCRRVSSGCLLSASLSKKGFPLKSRTLTKRFLKIIKTRIKEMPPWLKREIRLKF